MYRTEVATGHTVKAQPYINTTNISLTMPVRDLFRGATYKFSVRNSNRAVDGKKSRFSEELSYSVGMYTQ